MRFLPPLPGSFLDLAARACADAVAAAGKVKMLRTWGQVWSPSITLVDLGVCVKHAEHCDDTSDSNIFVCMEFGISVLWHLWCVIYCDSMSAFFKKLVTGTFSISKQLKLMTRLAPSSSTYLWYLWLPRPYSSVVEQCYDLVDGPRPLGDFDARMEIRSVRGLQNDDKTDMCFRYFITSNQ